MIARTTYKSGLSLLGVLLFHLVFAAAARAQAHYQSYVFSTFAGVPPGSADGSGAAARFFSPSALTIDSAGNSYVVDEDNRTIRKVTPAGIVTTLAGTAQAPGNNDGTGSAARFRDPRGIVSDSAGNLYVIDTGSRAIRKIAPGGVVSTLGTSTSFFFPEGIAIDASGNIYVGDECTIYKVTPGGTVSTFAGSSSCGSTDGTGTAAKFNSVLAMTTDTAGNLYVADAANNIIRKVTPAAVVTTIAGTAKLSGSSDGTGANARFNFPEGIAVDSSGNVFIADTDNHTIREIDGSGKVFTIAGVASVSGGTDGSAHQALFYYPTGIAVSSSGVIEVGDAGNSSLRLIVNGTVSTLAGVSSSGSSDGPKASAHFTRPNNVALDPAGNVYVADTVNSTIRKITTDGTVSTLAGLAQATGAVDGLGSSARFNQPEGIAVDSAGYVYVADTNNHTIRKITPDGNVSTLAGFAGSHGTADGIGDYARFRYPAGIAVGSDGYVYVSDTQNSSIRKISPSGSATTLAGYSPYIGQANGTGLAALFNVPRGIALDTAGNVYVGDTGSNVIRKVSPSGAASVLAGSFGTYGYTDATGSAARFYSPQGVAVDANGNVYVADEMNDAIRKITPTGATSTLGGSGVSHDFGFSDGVGTAARFSAPSGIAADSSGNVYIADSLSNSIRLGELAPLGFANAVSRKSHGSAGNYDLTLSLSTPPSIEPRSSGSNGTHTILLNFTTDMSSANVNLTSGIGSIANTTVAGTAVTVNLTGVSDAQTLQFSVTNATDTLGRSLSPFALSASFLFADVNGDGVVNSADALQNRSRSGQGLNTANYRSDLNIDGSINAADAAIVRAQSGRSLP